MKKAAALILSLCLAAGCLNPAQLVFAGGLTATAAGVDAPVTVSEGRTDVLNGLHFASDYEEIYNALKKISWYYYDDYYIVEEEDVQGSAKESFAVSAPAAGAAFQADADVALPEAAPVPEVGFEGAQTSANTSSADPDYSNTNLRDEAVDEADIVKTDGSYIYTIKDSEELIIVKADKGEMTVTSRTAIGEESSAFVRSVKDFYLDGDRLYVISLDRESERPLNARGYYGSYRYYTSLYTYDITDKEAPALIGHVFQEGSYAQSRKKDGYIYLYSTWWPDIASSLEDSRLAPNIMGEELPAEKICLPNILTEEQYLVISSIDVSEPDKIKDTDALVSGGESFYVSANSIFVMNTSWQSSIRTEITRFTYDSGDIRPVADVFLKGTVNNSFSIDEYNGYVRVLLTYTGYLMGGRLGDWLAELTGERYTQKNGLVVLDSDLREVGFLTGIARNEEIRSARYMGDKAYFVTYRNTDPLFAVDLSDPAAPAILGEVKVTGFSSYLHPYGEGLLLGFGYESDPSTGWTTGLKLSLFDISDPADIQEMDRYVVPGITYCPAMEDYKLVLCQPGKNLIGFYSENRYFLFRAEKTEAREGEKLPEMTIERLLIYDLLADGLYDSSYNSSTKGLYIGDELYIRSNSFIVAIDLNTLTRDSILML